MLLLASIYTICFILFNILPISQMRKNLKVAGKAGHSANAACPRALALGCTSREVTWAAGSVPSLAPFASPWALSRDATQGRLSECCRERAKLLWDGLDSLRWPFSPFPKQTNKKIPEKKNFTTVCSYLATVPTLKPWCIVTLRGNPVPSCCSDTCADFSGGPVRPGPLALPHHDGSVALTCSAYMNYVKLVSHAKNYIFHSRTLNF